MLGYEHFLDVVDFIVVADDLFAFVEKGAKSNSNQRKSEHFPPHLSEGLNFFMFE